MTSSAIRPLVDDHREMSSLLAEFVRESGREDRGTVLRRLDRIWARLAVHIRAEHLVLFEVLRGHESHAGAPDPEEREQALARLREDHDHFMRELGEAVNLLRRAAREDASASLPGPLADRVHVHVRRVIEGLRSHDRLEEERVYRWLDQVLDDDGRIEVGERIRTQLDRLPPRLDDEAG